MKILILTFILALGTAWGAPALKVGDLLLQPTDCWSCNLIEAEEQSIYSHIGIVLQVSPEILVAESLGSVRLVTLAEFDAKTEKGQELGVYRFTNQNLVNHLQETAEDLRALFASDFEGLTYDRHFLWDNYDEKGEMLYCSEFVAKLLQAFVNIDPPMKRMMFARRPEMWQRYFHGNVPVGKWGNSPADYEKSDKFYFVGEL